MPNSAPRSRYFVTALLIAGGILIAYLCFRIVLPFLAPVVWATVLAVLLHPLQRRMPRRVRNRSAVAAALCVLTALLVGVPLFYLIISVPGQIKEGLTRLEALVRPDGTGDPRLQEAWERSSELAARAGYDLGTAVRSGLHQAGVKLVSLAPRAIRQAAEYAAGFALTLFTLFFFLRDREKLLHWLGDLVPLGPEQTSDLFRKVRDVMRATVLGGFAVALAQGSLGGVLFWALGIPTPILWGVLMAILSMLPPFGAWLVWLPAGAILVWQDHIAKGIILLAGGALGISLVDNFLRPIIIGQRTRLPTLLVFFSLLGGLQLFGPVGLIAGPVLMSLLIGILDFTRERVKRATGEA